MPLDLDAVEKRRLRALEAGNDRAAAVVFCSDDAFALIAEVRRLRKTTRLFIDNVESYAGIKACSLVDKRMICFRPQMPDHKPTVPAYQYEIAPKE